MMITRTKLIEEHVSRYIRETGAKQLGWAQDVVRIYHDRTALEHRSVPFHQGGDAEADGRANRQILKRMFDPDEQVRLPVDLEEAAVFSLPQPYRNRLRGELAARYGLLNAEIPQGSAADWCSDGGLFMRETGDALMRLAPVVADGEIDENDHCEELREALEGMRAVQSMSTQIIAALSGALDKQEDKHGGRRSLKSVRAA